MRNYSAEVTRFVKQLLAPYSENIGLDFASFRPLEEHGRDLPLKKRNDLLHVDAFPRGRHGLQGSARLTKSTQQSRAAG